MKGKAAKRKAESADREESASSSDNKEEMDSSGSEWLRSELQQMMFGMGDSQHPLPTSVSLVETVLSQQMALLLELAVEVWSSRGARGPLQPKDLLILLAHDKVKLGRVLRYLCFKDERGRLLSETSSVAEEEAEAAAGAEEEEADSILGSSSSGVGGGQPGEEEEGSSDRKHVRRRMCAAFLNLIDQTGELKRLLDEDQADGVKQQRQLRLERQTRFMAAERYVHFSQARTASFTRKQRVNKFREWIRAFQPYVTVSAVALDILSYFAHETVAQLVDLCFLVKSDGCGTDLCFLQPMDEAGGEKNRLGKRKRGNEHATELTYNSAIQPNEILEAMRRFNRSAGAMTLFSKSFATTTRRKLLCL